jgi:hypothetical protein
VVDHCVDISERKRAEAERECFRGTQPSREKYARGDPCARGADGRQRLVDEYREKFIGRLSALARACRHELEGEVELEYTQAGSSFELVLSLS